jgi:arylsulfatase A-like enzyme
MRPISRRKFLAQAAGAAAVASLPARMFAQAAPAAKRNVLFLMSDDMRVELGCYASRFGAQTPNLDKLAKAGVRFDRNYCQFPLCNPSRASMLTGRHATTTGVLGNRTDFRKLHDDYVSLPQLFKENGYASLRTGKIFHGGIDDPKAWTEGGGIQAADGVDIAAAQPQSAQTEPTEALTPGAATRPARAGFRGGGRPGAGLSKAANSDRIIVLDGNGEGNGDYNIADRAIDYLNRYKDKPFFLACGFTKPHSPPAAPKRLYDLYDLDKIELTPDFAAVPTVPPGFPNAAIRPRNADLFIGRPASVQEAKEVIRAYIASISWVDWNLGRVVGELERLGLRDNTLIVFVPDHGYQLGEKGKWSKAGSLFEMGTRIPMMIHAPGARGNGQTCYRTVESVNIYRTVAELCGLTVPPGNEGRSLTPLLDDPTAPWDHPAFSVWSEDGSTLHGTAIRTENWRYAEFDENGINGAMLFDVHKDPLEMTNLADDPNFAAVRAELSPLVRKYASNLGKTQMPMV